MNHSEDAQQRDRIRSADTASRLLVEAGPGTGKTEMAALRMASLIDSGLAPGKMLVLSFSRSAVRTLTSRLTHVADTGDAILEELRHVSIRTFDSWAFRILRLLGHPVSKLLKRRHDENIAELTKFIVSRQREQIQTLIGDRRHLIIDEFQDLPGVRGELVLALLDLLAPPGHPGTGFTILGDPAQAIYGFAANGTEQTYPTPAQYWKKITDEYGDEIELYTLTRNYRANAPLADLSASLRNVLLGDRPNEEKLRIVRDAVVSLPSPSEPVGPAWLNEVGSTSSAILTRTNGQAIRVLQKLLGTEVIGQATPVRLKAGNYASLPPAWVAALLRPLRSTQLTKSQFSNIYDHLTKEWDDTTRLGLGLPSRNATWCRLARASGAPEDATAIRISALRERLNWPDSFPDDQIAGEDGLIVTTIHQSKGQEFDIVTVLDTAGNDMEHNDDMPNDNSALEEAHVHYVAVTRAGLKLNRLDGKDLYKAPQNRTFQNDHDRLCYWRNGWMNLEIGLNGDLDPFGFVDPNLHGGTNGVLQLQDFLLRNARTIEGHKVMLCKHVKHRKAVVWHIHLQEGKKPGMLIGRTTSQLTYDLLDVPYSKGFALPKTIMNLRISSVGTVSSDAEFPLEEPYRTSKLWLGISLFGTGDFKTYQRRY